MVDSIFEVLKELNRGHFYRIWRMAQNNELEELTEEEQRLGRIMLEHSDEYFNQFEFADVLADHDFDPESESNPFLHVVLHAAAEKQVEDRNPIEAFQFYNAMLRKKCTPHEAIHILSATLIKFLFPVLKGEGRFSLDSYRNFLKRYKSRKPEKIFELLESEPDAVVDGGLDPKGAQIMDEVLAAFEDKEFGSTEEAYAFADTLMANKNAEPIAEFLGLSAEQMYRLLYRPFTEVSDILVFNKDLLKEELHEIPMVKEAVYFLRRLGELQPLRATAKGNLPQAFARELHDRFPEHPLFHYPIRSEGEDLKIMALRHLLNMAGWIKKRGQKFSLTKKGEAVVKDGIGVGDFYRFFEIYTQRFNWGFRDHYPPLDIIQQSALFSCYFLHQKAKTPIHVSELSTHFIQAFPTILDEVGSYLSMEPEEIVHGAFFIRFIERFCKYFGLVTTQREERRPNYIECFVHTTPLFEKIFLWT